MTSQRELMLRGEQYFSNDPELVEARLRAKRLCHKYNQEPIDLDKAVLKELLGYETDAYVEAPFRCDYGVNIRFGKMFYSNYNLTILDCALVTFGDNIMIAPNVTIATAGHPIDPQTRISGWEFAKPITIGDRVWIGANVTILPGVTIGADTVIGAGSVVTKDIPARVVAVGNPCRVLREIKEGENK
eukprot:TRINITY_DN2548_c0_g1_i1.p1 TRINITY_DN2548_c0_g1~~TRINITY_DN2548_c0_g1_i1.p1  ORF type:complete len:212 (-),score=34.35 TRINITY_DN2548_c0_g1_i1:126-686(-)